MGVVHHSPDGSAGLGERHCAGQGLGDQGIQRSLGTAVAGNAACSVATRVGARSRSTITRRVIAARAASSRELRGGRSSLSSGLVEVFTNLRTRGRPNLPDTLGQIDPVLAIIN